MQLQVWIHNLRSKSSLSSCNFDWTMCWTGVPQAVVTYDHHIHPSEIHIELSADLDDYCPVPRSMAAATPSTAENFNQCACQTGPPHRRLSLPSRLVADKLMHVRRSDKPNFWACNSTCAYLTQLLHMQRPDIHGPKLPETVSSRLVGWERTLLSIPPTKLVHLRRNMDPNLDMSSCIAGTAISKKRR